MRRALPIVLGLMVLAGATAARPPTLMLPLVRAQCNGAVPCQPAFAFRTGTAQLTGAREPAPTCPKTGKPSETPGGAVQLTGVTQFEQFMQAGGQDVQIFLCSIDFGCVNRHKHFARIACHLGQRGLPEPGHCDPPRAAGGGPG